MSLDVSLIVPGIRLQHTTSGIFIRENGRTVEISAEEWNRRHPNDEPVSIAAHSVYTDTVFEKNMTHNLNKMAEAAGIYNELWRPEEIGITKAHQLTEVLKNGLMRLKESPDHFKKYYNPANGWGNYEQLVEFVEEYLNACIQYPQADVHADR